MGYIIFYTIITIMEFKKCVTITCCDSNMSGMLPLLLLIVTCQVALGCGQIAVYQMYEHCFPVAEKYKNPFDYNEVFIGPLFIT